MRFSIAVVLATVGLAAAQSTGGAAPQPSSNCAAQNIVEACKSTTQIQVDNCPVQDWNCLCEAYKTVLTCYNSCPGDPNRYAAEAQMTANCNAADSQSAMSAAHSTTSSGAAASSAASQASQASQASESASASTSGSRSATSSGFSTNTGTNAAEGFTVPAAGSLFAAALGLAAML